MPRPNAGTKGVPRLDREGQILDIASRRFGTDGFAATSIAAIAREAGISKPLIYSYFGSKEGLFGACVERGGALLAEEIERIARGDAVGIARGMATLGGMFALLEPQPHLWRLLMDDTAPKDGAVAASLSSYTARITDLATEGVAELMALAGNTDPLDVSAMTSVWLGIVDSLMTWWVEHPGVSAAEMLQRCLRLVDALFGDHARLADAADGAPRDTPER